MTNPTALSLPDLLHDAAGTAVISTAHWLRRRCEVHDSLLALAYGPMPKRPNGVQCETLHTATAQGFGGARLLTCRIETGSGQGFMLRVFVPSGGGPFPVLLHGDGCWHYASDAVIGAVLARGFVFAQFNRVEIAADSAPGANAALPSSRFFAGQQYGALAAWAWGYHRAVDALQQLEWVDAACIAVVGHSRGGKAAMLAGATDRRIALTSANNSGAAGAGCFRLLGVGAETLADVTRVFPHWFGPGLAQFAGREHALPFDQHFLKALIAPRALLTTEALGDLWGNPSGSWHTHTAARAVYGLLDVPQRIAIAYRAGGHGHTLADWLVLLDFADWVFRGKQRPRVQDDSPFE
ncbi:MAG: acetylxylan esterase [Rhodoferax sp.]|nr:acetylxylan esterase [Rhodoferax sp.]